MHPDDAAVRGLSDGDEVRIFNALGEVRCGLQVGTWVRPGTVVLPEGTVAEAHSQRLHRQCSGPRLADRSWRRRVLQRRPRRRATGQRIGKLVEERPNYWPRGLKVSPRGEPYPAAGAYPAAREWVRAGHGRHGCSDHPCGQLPVLRPASTREPCLFRGRRDRPCWRSRAASRDSSKQIRDVLCALRPQHPPDDSIPIARQFPKSRVHKLSA